MCESYDCGYCGRHRRVEVEVPDTHEERPVGVQPVMVTYDMLVEELAARQGDQERPMFLTAGEAVQETEDRECVVGDDEPGSEEADSVPFLPPATGIPFIEAPIAVVWPGAQEQVEEYQGVDHGFSRSS